METSGEKTRRLSWKFEQVMLVATGGGESLAVVLKVEVIVTSGRFCVCGEMMSSAEARRLSGAKKKKCGPRAAGVAVTSPPT